MSEEFNLVTELAIILIAAGVFTIISRALKQPLILGYIIAGFLISPHLGLIPHLGGTEAVKQWSEIGIIFLLFALGLEFSFKKLLAVGSSALITAGTQCCGMFVIGTVTGNLMGWSQMESIFLGGMLSMSSTTIIIKAFDDMGLKKKPYAGLIFGSLVVEDLIAVLLMVLLSTMAVSNKFSGGEMVWSIAKLVFYIVVWFLFGIFIIPSLLKRARKFLNDEILLILSIGLCFGMVTLAQLAGFSSALGAFVMGSILAETMEGERISNLMGSIKNLFGAIFFVSVGMMIDPAVIAEHWLPILILTVVAMSGILICSTSGVLLAGKGLDTAIHSGFSLAQVGEFAFIIASLGCSLGVLRDYIYPVIIAVSVITTFTTPYMIKAGDPAYSWLQKHLPKRWLDRLSTKEDKSKSSKAEKGEWKKLLRAYALRVGLYLVVIIAISLLSNAYLDKLTVKFLPDAGDVAVSLVNVIVTLLLMAPAIYGLAVTNGAMSTSAVKLRQEKDSNKWPLLSLSVLRIFLAVDIVITVIMGRFQLKGLAFAAVLLITIVLLLFAKYSRHIIPMFEVKFFHNLNEKENEMKKSAPVTNSVREKLAGHDVHLENFTVSPEFLYIGKQLKDMPFRKVSQANIIKIVRGSRKIVIPSGDEYLYPGDKLLVVGESDQLSKFKSVLSESIASVDNEADSDFQVVCFQVSGESYLCGKALSAISMRANGCMVISVLRGDKFITNPKADFVFENGDTLWMAGEKASCEWYK